MCVFVNSFIDIAAYIYLRIECWTEKYIITLID